MSSKWVRIVQAIVLLTLAADVGYWLVRYENALQTGVEEAGKAEDGMTAVLSKAATLTAATGIANVYILKVVCHTVIGGCLVAFVGLFRKDSESQTRKAEQPKIEKAVQQPIQKPASRQTAVVQGGWG